MAKIGKFNRLQVVKEVDFGLYLDGEDLGEILLPRRYIPRHCTLGDWLEAFIYLDSDDYLIATTQSPDTMVDQCAHLKVAQVNKMGAFLAWGLPKDLLVPFSEQTHPMEEGKFYAVFVYLDHHTNRLTASSKLDKFLSEKSAYFKRGQAVDLLVVGKSEMGYKAAINHTHLGLIFRDDAFKPLKIGEKIKGYIKGIRSDRKIDLCLQQHGKNAHSDLTQHILNDLAAQGGASALTDNSPPQAIYKRFNVSKGKYKKALATLYKQRQILIEKDKITLVDHADN